jgi:uncharacterized membrane protein
MPALASAPSPYSRSLEFLGVVSLLLFALALRLFQLTSESAWCDEVLTTAHLPAATLQDFLQSAFRTDKALAPWPAYYLLEYAWSTCFGPSLPALRALSITLNLLMLALLYLRARLSLAAGPALFCLLLATLSLSQIYYAQEIRFYAWIGLVAVAADLSLTWALRTRNRAVWAIHLLCSAALLLSHAFTLLLFPVFFLRVVLHCGCRAGTTAFWSAAHLVLLAGFYAWRILPYDLSTSSMAYNDAPTSLRALPQAWLFLAGARAGTEGASAYLPLGAPVELLYALLLALLLLLLLRAVLQEQGERSVSLDRVEGVHLLLWALLPAAALWGASMLWRPCFFPRYVLYSAPAIFLCAAVGFSLIRGTAVRRSIVLMVLLLGGYLALGMPRPFRPDYQHWALEVKQETSRPAILALKRYNALAAGYVLAMDPEAIQCHGMPDLQAAALRHLQHGTPVWAVFHHWGELDAFTAWLAAQGLRFERRQYGGLPPLYAYRIEASPGPGQVQRVE